MYFWIVLKWNTCVKCNCSLKKAPKAVNLGECLSSCDEFSFQGQLKLINAQISEPRVLQCLVQIIRYVVGLFSNSCISQAWPHVYWMNKSSLSFPSGDLFTWFLWLCMHSDCLINGEKLDLHLAEVSKTTIPLGLTKKEKTE